MSNQRIEVNVTQNQLTVDVTQNQLFIEMPSKEILQLEVQVSVVSPSQIILLNKIRSDSQNIRDRVVKAEIASKQSAIDAASSEKKTLGYLNKTEKINNDTQLLHDNTDKLHSQTSVLHGETKQFKDQSENASGEAENSAVESEKSKQASSANAVESEKSKQASAVSAVESEKFKQASFTSAVESEKFKQASKKSAEAAKISETNSKQSETAAKLSETKSEQSANQSASSAIESKRSAEDSILSADDSAKSQAASKVSETNAAKSEASAKSSEKNSAKSAVAARVSERKSAESEKSAKTSATSSAKSESGSKSAQTASESAKDLSRKWATEDENIPVADGNYSSLHWAKVAEKFASTLTNGMYFAGQWDLSNGLPPEPTTSQVPWYRIIGNDISKISQINDELKKLSENSNKGDQLVWEPVDKKWFLIDTTDEVWMVNGKKGNVTLNAGDVGALSLTGGKVKGTVTNNENRLRTIESDDFTNHYGRFYMSGAYTYIVDRSVPNTFQQNGIRLRQGVATPQVYHAVDGEKTVTWDIYHEGNKPTASDIDAAPKNHTHSEYTLPPGIITMFAGIESQIPGGWQLCNGKGVTSNGIKIPNLIDRFIVGSGSGYVLGDTGGEETGTTSSNGAHGHLVRINAAGGHNHAVTVDNTILSESQMPSHYHIQGATTGSGTIGRYGMGDGGSNSSHWDTAGRKSGRIGLKTQSKGSSNGHTHSAYTNSTGPHTHSGSINSAGAHTHDVRTLPPYYALAYIIKL